MIGSASSASVFRIGPEVRSIDFCFTHFLKSLPVKIIKFTSAANMSAWRTMIRITYGEGKVNLENSRNKHALSRKDGEDNQNSKIKAFDCTPRAAIG